MSALGRGAGETPMKNGNGGVVNGNGKLVVVPPTPEVTKEEQTSRRGNGVYRGHAGAVASTPDLRKKGKDKDKEGKGGVEGREDGTNAGNFLSPGGVHGQGGGSPRLRGSSSTSSFSLVSASGAGAPPRTPSKDEDTSIDWGVTSPRARSGSKSGKSIRMRATNFFGKMLGQGQDSVRDKAPKSPSAANAPYTPPPLFARYTKEAPPVPQLPENLRLSSYIPPSLDVFGSPDTAKPLPHQPKTSKTDSENAVEDATLTATSPNFADRTVRSHTRGKNSTSSMRRRSASVSELDYKKLSMDVPLPDDAPRSAVEPRKGSTDWDTNGIMSIFKNDLSQLEAIAPTSLEITDPSTPARRQRASRSPASMEQPRNESLATIRPKMAGRASTSAIDIRDGLKVDIDSSTGSHSPVSISPGSRSSIVVPESPVRSAGRRTVPRPGPPLSASAHYVPPPSRTVSTPLLGPPSSTPSSTSVPTTPIMGANKSRSATAPVSFTNPFTQPSVVVSSSTPQQANRRDSIQPRPSASFSEPVLSPDEPNMLRRPSHPHMAGTPDPGGRSVRLVPSSGSFYPTSGSASQVDIGMDNSPSKSVASSSSLALPRSVSMDIGGEDLEERGQELARKFWNDDESFLSKEKFAEWLGGAGRLNAVALHYYMDFHDFQKSRLDHAFRQFCAKLYLKAETQQIDRILSQFSRRYWECNPNSIYGNSSVVHAVAYSVLLLNTDLHIADLSTHMSRTQFVRNTLQAIQTQARPPTTRSSTPDLTYDDARSLEGNDMGNTTIKSRSKRSSSVHSWTSVSPEAAAAVSSPPTMSPSGSGSLSTSTASVDTPTSSQAPMYAPYSRSWELMMENTLREIYTAVKSQEIRQPSGFQIPTNQLLAPNTPYNTLGRHRSQRGQDRMATLKRGSLRGLQSLLGSSPYSSNSSVDGRDPRNGRVSPSPSFATSDGDIPSSNFTPALGFASNLSHTIIREAQEDDDRSISSVGSADTDVSISEEELALLGAPWAKEGMLCRKQYWESTGKRAKSKSWQDVFVVIQKGELDMFIFGDGGPSRSTGVGGGNWLSNAQSVGNIILAHSLAHVLPPPGYNRQRPHCFALSLANGGVYFFQAGTEDLLNEWVSTCNYWAARQSKEPLSGGVSNMEYGWNRVLDPLTQIQSMHNDDSMSVIDNTDTFSMRSFKSRSNDRIHINDWKAPMPSTVPSTHDEETQLDALKKQIGILTAELQTHNELQQPMMALYGSRSSNLAKAQANWEKRSKYLLTEIVKYETYVESLKSAMGLRLKRRGEKALEKALGSATPLDADFTNTKHGRNSSSPGDDTIIGCESSHPGQGSHRREGAVDVEEDDLATP